MFYEIKDLVTNQLTFSSGSFGNGIWDVYHGGCDIHDGKWYLSWNRYYDNNSNRKLFTGFCNLDGSEFVAFERTSSYDSRLLDSLTRVYNNVVYVLSLPGAGASNNDLEIYTCNLDGSNWTNIITTTVSRPYSTIANSLTFDIVDDVIYITMITNETNRGNQFRLITVTTSGINYVETVLRSNPHGTDEWGNHLSTGYEVKSKYHDGRIYYIFRESNLFYLSDAVFCSIKTDVSDLDFQATTIYSCANDEEWSFHWSFSISNNIVYLMYLWHTYTLIEDWWNTTEYLVTATCELNGSNFNSTIQKEFEMNLSSTRVCDIIIIGESIIYAIQVETYDENWDWDWHGIVFCLGNTKSQDTFQLFYLGEGFYRVTSPLYQMQYNNGKVYLTFVDGNSTSNGSLWSGYFSLVGQVKKFLFKVPYRI